MVKTRTIFSTLTATLFLAALMVSGGTAEAKTRLAFSGGPDGGTFQYFSNAISSRLSRNLPNVEVSNMASAGSVENLRRVNSGDADFGVVYAGDIYLGMKGELTNDTREYKMILPSKNGQRAKRLISPPPPLG
ncbi:TAXI family TRAP transporter solute-binding subunit [Geoalkalibacter sp.]|uniref:TAXI family TRAP transporter solute-binding subunit n=1 Tax=Geoalkalibacter sp. TaxID=3041440 RepID=UPI00272DC973|nr:TAXI family TRAP transporter solute-binding subunit [Geoalkalibacter sp.]